MCKCKNLIIQLVYGDTEAPWFYLCLVFSGHKKIKRKKKQRNRRYSDILKNNMHHNGAKYTYTVWFTKNEEKPNIHMRTVQRIHDNQKCRWTYYLPVCVLAKPMCLVIKVKNIRVNCCWLCYHWLGIWGKRRRRSGILKLNPVINHVILWIFPLCQPFFDHKYIV